MEKTKLELQEEQELAMAEDDFRNKGFFKDLFWRLLGFSTLFSGIGLLIIYVPNKINHNWAIASFCSVVLLNFVVIRLYIKHPSQKIKQN